MMEDSETGKETNRDRVRRLLLTPLGFRAAKGVDPDAARKTLDEVADYLAYMADDNLRALRECLQTKGQGAARSQWPDRATFLGFAEMYQKRPIEELPALMRWFRSIEGQRMVMDGTLVETWEYFQSHKVPPVTDAARRFVIERADQRKRRIQILREKQAANWQVADEDVRFEAWYSERLAYCMGLVTAGQDGQGVAA